MREVNKRTPSYPSWQQKVWLTHCKQPCAFIGFADGKTIEPFIDELQNDINALGIDRDYILQNLMKDGSLIGYLFQGLKCKQHRLHVDSD